MEDELIQVSMTPWDRFPACGWKGFGRPERIPLGVRARIPCYLICLNPSTLAKVQSIS
jgi:hypothetical protein